MPFSTIQFGIDDSSASIPLQAIVASTGAALTGQTGKVKVQSDLKSYSDSANNVTEIGGGAYTIQLVDGVDFTLAQQQIVSVIWTPATATPMQVSVQVLAGLNINSMGGSRINSPNTEGGVPVINANNVLDVNLLTCGPSNTTVGDGAIPNAAAGNAAGLVLQSSISSLKGYASSAPPTISGFEIEFGSTVFGGNTSDNILQGMRVRMTSGSTSGLEFPIYSSSHVSSSSQRVNFLPYIAIAPAQNDQCEIVSGLSTVGNATTDSGFPCINGTVTTGTNTTTFTDTSLIGQPVNKIKNMFLTWTGDTSGSLAPSGNYVSDFDTATGVVTLGKAAASTPAIGQTYRLFGWTGA